MSLTPMGGRPQDELRRKLATRGIHVTVQGQLTSAHDTRQVLAALRLSIAIGRDAQSESLNRFIGDPSVPVIVADSTEDIADRLVAASLAVSRMSESGADRGEVARKLFGMQSGVDVPSAIFNQDTII